MRANVGLAMKLIAGSEGGYVNHPKDPGGATNKGVTLATFRAYRKRKGIAGTGIADLKKITAAEVEDIFRSGYWNRVRGDELPAGLDYIVADFAFNSGPGQAGKELQRVVTALGYDAQGSDGSIGPKTLAAVRDAVMHAGEDAVIKAYMAKRLKFMKSLNTWATFGKGWTNRINEVRANGLNIAHDDPTFAPTPMADNRGKLVSAKADPADVKAMAIPGGTSTAVSIGGAVTAAATTASGQLMEQSAWSPYAIYLIFGAIALTVVASIVTVVILKGRAAEEGTV